MALRSAAAVLAAIMGGREEAISAEPPAEPRITPPMIMRGDRSAIDNCYSQNGRRRAAEGRTVVEVTVQPDGSASELKFAPGILAWQEQSARCVIAHEEIEEAYRDCYPPDSVTIARPQYKVTINAGGKVTASELVESSGDDAMDRAGTCMFDRVRFDPATRDGEPIGMTLTLPMLVRPPK